MSGVIDASKHKQAPLGHSCTSKNGRKPDSSQPKKLNLKKAQQKPKKNNQKHYRTMSPMLESKKSNRGTVAKYSSEENLADTRMGTSRIVANALNLVR